MKACELKVNDWVSFKEPKTQEVCNGQVKTVTDSMCRIEYKGSYLVALSDLNPITIDDEILKNNGFKKDDIGYYRKKKFRLCNITEFNPKTKNVWIIEVNNNYDILATVEYIHELQHILWALNYDDNLKI